MQNHITDGTEAPPTVGVRVGVNHITDGTEAPPAVGVRVGVTVEYGWGGGRREGRGTGSTVTLT